MNRPPTVRRREIVLHAHISGAAVTVEQVRAWCGNPGPKVVVTPVLDLA